jgi:hypothetical protein
MSISLPRDNNRVTAIGGVSSTDGVSVVAAYVNPTNHRLLVDLGSGSGVTLQTNGTNNGSQTLLNLVAGTNITLTDNGSGSITIASSGGSGTVTSVSVATANGVSGTVATSTTTPAITLTLGAITPTTVNGVTFSGSGSIANSGTSSLTGFTGSGTHSGTSSGTNTGDQTITLTGGVTGSGTGSFAATVVTNANLTGGVTSVGNATTVVTNANLTGAVTSVGNATSLGSFTSANLSGALTDETGSGAAVFGTNPTIAKPVMNARNQTAQTYSPAGAGTATLDLSLADQHDITMPAGNITIALTNDTNNQIFSVSITQDATGSRTVTWFTTIKWAGGSAPTLTTTASKRDRFVFVRTGSGTYDGMIAGQNI